MKVATTESLYFTHLQKCADYVPSIYCTSIIMDNIPNIRLMLTNPISPTNIRSMTFPSRTYCIPKNLKTKLHRSHATVQCTNRWSTFSHYTILIPKTCMKNISLTIWRKRRKNILMKGNWKWSLLLWWSLNGNAVVGPCWEYIFKIFLIIPFFTYQKNITSR